MKLPKEIERMADDYCGGVNLQTKEGWISAEECFLAGANAVLPDMRMALECLEWIADEKSIAQQYGDSGNIRAATRNDLRSVAREALAKLERWKE